MAIDIINLEKHTLNFNEYNQSEYKVGLKTLLQQGILQSQQVYRLKRIVEKPSFHDQFKRPSSIIKEWDTPWMLCDSLHAWL